MTDQKTEFGRVDADGTVYVRTAEGERSVGQWPDGDPDAALAFYQVRYDGLAVEVDLLQQRIKAGALSPEEAAASVKRMRETVANAQAVGDLGALMARLDSLRPLIEARQAERKAERAAKVLEAKAAKEKIAEDAEKLAASDDWRGGANRLRDLLQTWKALPRIDKASDEALWHRFSSARTTYTRRRKQHFGDLSEKREAAKVAKSALVTEAEELAGSTEWGATARAYRDLMLRWKAVGSAQKDDDDALWKRFRAAQDAFFEARDAVNAQIDTEYAANAETKRRLLVDAEKLLPVTDVKTAREAFRAIAERWDAAGKVPRKDMADLEGRFKRVEQAVRGAEDASWRRSNPEAFARASETVAKLEATLAGLRSDLEKAEAAGNTRSAADIRASIEARQSWLDEANKALREFSAP
jgi:Domain of Unknown Function (DUF349)